MPADRSVDHIMLRLTTAEPLFDLFSSVFGLPVAWPLQHAAFATYGWVHAGNTDLEFWAATSNADLPGHAQPPLVHGFALEPALPLPQALERTAAAGIASKPARTFQSSNAQGEVVTNFTNAVVLDLSAPSCCIFFCEWNSRAAIYPWAEAATPVQRRARHRQALQESRGGPLGLIGLKSIHMGTPELGMHRKHWQTLSGSPSGHPTCLRRVSRWNWFPQSSCGSGHSRSACTRWSRHACSWQAANCWGGRRGRTVDRMRRPAHRPH